MTNEVRVNTSLTLEDMETPLGTALSASAEQFWKENPLPASLRQQELEEAQGGVGVFGPHSQQPLFFTEEKSRIDQDNALKQVKEAGVSLEIGTEGISQEALDILITRKREEIKRQSLIQSAPSGFWNGAAQLGTGLAVSLADPINIGVSFIPVVGQARYTSMIANASGALGRAGVRAKVGAASGVLGAAVVEPFVLSAMTLEQADYDMYDSLLNITFGGVLGGGLHAGAGAIGDVIAKARPQTKSDILRAAVGQAMDEKPIDVSKVAEESKSFREAFRDLEISKAMDEAKVSEVNPKVKAEFDKALDEVTQRQVSKFEAMQDEAATKALKQVKEQGPSKAMIEEAAAIASKRIDDFKAEPQNPPQLNEIDIPEPKSFDDLTPSQALNEVELETNDIFTALEESGEDLTVIRESVKELETKHTRDLEGIKAGVLCAIGQ